MPKRTEPSARATITVPQPVLSKLNAYRQALLKRRGRRATQADIIGALIEGVPLWQAELMLESYRPQAEDSDEAAETGQ